MRFEDRTFISLDLGTSNTIAHINGQGIIYNEPSLLAYDVETNELIAFGQEAYNMLGKTNEGIRFVEPIQSGAIADLDAAKELIVKILGRIQLNTNSFKGAVVLLACPSQVTELEKTAFIDMSLGMGASYAIIEQAILLGAVGADVPVESLSGHVVMDIGGGTTDIAIIAYNKIIDARTVRAAGRSFDQEIAKYIKSEYNVMIGDVSSEKIKIEIGSLQKYKEERTMKVFGRDVISGLPKEVQISSEEIRNVMIAAFTKITDLVIELLENVQPELAGDVVRNGITVTGGGAMIRGVDKYFEDIFLIPCKKAKEPLNCVINGAAEFKKVLVKRYEDGLYDKK